MRLDWRNIEIEAKISTVRNVAGYHLPNGRFLSPGDRLEDDKRCNSDR
jgi:hypothetical protein